MAKRRGPAGGRGSPEAVAKRRAARQLNTLLGANQIRPGLDGRTEKRRQRLIKELKDGRRGVPLKPIDVVAHVNELMDLGESIGSLKKLGVKPRKVEATPEILAIVDRTQEAYGFRADAWRMLGLRVDGTPGGGGGGRRRKKA